MDLNFTGGKKKLCEKKYSIITLDLFKPTKKSYPEFDYEQICKKHLNEDESSGEDERFHDREAEELVRRLQQKYGGKRDKRGRRIRFGEADDFMDKSAGYDLDDPFIDDAEAYDEHVPSTMDTIKGGFYVNKGKLEFRSKYAHDSDSDVVDSPVKRKTTEKRRRVASDEDEEESVSKPSTSKSGDVNVEEENGTADKCPLRLSSNGAPPTAGGSDSASRRLIKQQIIKRRRLMGQPPTAKIAPSPAVKAAMGVKKKLKAPLKKTAGSNSPDELNSFMNEITGGISLDEGMEEFVDDVSKEKSPSVAPETPEKAKALTAIEADIETKHSASVTTPAAEDSWNSCPAKRGRPPGSTSEAKNVPVMSTKLNEMIELYKKKTGEFGAPEKKIRLPPSLVDLCLKIEEQCSSEGLNHSQKTRVFDMLANWVLVQRNSLYMRMKAQKDKREQMRNISHMAGTNGALAAPLQVETKESSALQKNASESEISASKTPLDKCKQNHFDSANAALGPTLNAEKEALPATAPKQPTTANNSQQQIPAINSLPKIATSANSVSKLSNASTPKIDNIPSVVDKAASQPQAAVKSSTPASTQLKSTQSSASFTPQKQVAAASKRDSSHSGLSGNAMTSLAAQGLSPQKLLAALTSTGNPQMLALLTLLQQQQAQGDIQQQQQQNAATLAAMQMQLNAAMMAASGQQSDLLAQYQLAFASLAKLSSQTTPQMKQQNKILRPAITQKVKKSPPQTSATTPKTSAPSSSSAVGAKPRTAPVQRPPAAIKSKLSQSGTSMSSQPQTASVNSASFQNVADKTRMLMELITQATVQATSAIESAINYSRNHMEEEAKKGAKEDGSTPPKRLYWTDELRAALKNLTDLMFSSLDSSPNSGTPMNPYSVVVKYLFVQLRPHFRGFISFEELVHEVVRLLPAKAELATTQDLKALIEQDAAEMKSRKLSRNSPTGCSRSKNAKPSESAPASRDSQHISQIVTHGSSKAKEESLKTAQSVISKPRVVQPMGQRNEDTNVTSPLLQTSNAQQKREANDAKSVTVPATAGASNGSSIQPQNTSETITGTVRKQPTPGGQQPERISTPVFSPKLTPGQKLILAREAEERERLKAERAAQEKAAREREEKEKEEQRRLQEELEREAAENRKRDEEAIMKWEQEEAQRLEEAAREEEAEREAAAEAERIRLEQEEATRQQLIEEQLEERRQEEVRRKQELEEELRRIEEEKKEEERRELEAKMKEEEARKAAEEEEKRAMQRLKAEEVEKQIEQVEDDILGRLSPFDFVVEQGDFSLQQEQDQLTNPEQATQGIQQNQATSSNCGYTPVIDNSPSSRDQRSYNPSFPLSQHGSPMFQQPSVSTASPQSVHSIPASPIQQPVASPMQQIPSSPSSCNRIQCPSTNSPSSFQKYTAYQQHQAQMNGQMQPMQRQAIQNVQQGNMWNCPVSSQDSAPNIASHVQVPEMQRTMPQMGSPVIHNSAQGMQTSFNQPTLPQANVISQSQCPSVYQQQSQRSSPQVVPQVNPNVAPQIRPLQMQQQYGQQQQQYPNYATSGQIANFQRPHGYGQMPTQQVNAPMQARSSAFASTPNPYCQQQRTLNEQQQFFNQQQPQQTQQVYNQQRFMGYQQQYSNSGNQQWR